ncbi:MAG: hypothetical protein MRERV_36c004 [Mycoplasmataceae bacterium RV_VA103A]|nr:MAG: hypothetical protein MRERV_36c004 [Mycoplasmataceae bacterium RV_VA103A]
MTKNQEFTGWIVDKEQKKVYDKGEWYGNPYFKLTVIKEKDQQKLTLFVYCNLVSEEIFQTIQSSQYVDKRYLFFCEKRKRGFILHNWQESHEKKHD